MTTQDFIPIVADLKEEFFSEDYAELIDRYEEKQVDLKSKLAQVVIGVRRCGKSTMCRKVLRQAGVKAAYLNFDDERLVGLETADLNNLLEATYIVYGDIEYLLLDEIQNVDNWPLFVNRLLRQRLHVLITGSNAKLLSTELISHLTGRYHKIELYPFSFKEFAEYKGVDLHNRSTRGTALSKACLEDYMTTGGFPELLTEDDNRAYIVNLFESIIRRDIANRFKIRKFEVLYKIGVYCVDNIGQELNINDIAKEFDVSPNTVANYIRYLHEAFLLLNINRFSYKSLERIRIPKNYIVDNAFITDRENTFMPPNKGWLLENVVYVELKRRASRKFFDIFFYRDKSFEIDFMITRNNKVEELYQVSYDVTKTKTLEREIKGLLKGRDKFKCDNLTLITLYKPDIKADEAPGIRIVSAVEWLASE